MTEAADLADDSRKLDRPVRQIDDASPSVGVP